jgi:type IV secretory pathway VirD2 relaxase
MVRIPAKVRKEHEAKMALFDVAIERAKAAEVVMQAMFTDVQFYDVLGEDAAKAISDQMNGAHDLVGALEGEKQFEEREFRMYGVDPYQRHLVANNID